MIPILICDDENSWLQLITREIENYQIRSDWEIELLCCASSPEELLTCMKEHQPQLGIYFLDIDLKASMNGLDLGKRIREYDPGANLIFITTHEEMLRLTLSMSFGVCNFLTKDTPEWKDQLQKTLDNLENFYRTWKQETSPSITIQFGSFWESIAKKDIYYIESVKNTHHIQIILKNSERNCPGSLTDLEQQLGEGFVFCRRDCLVNLAHIQSFDPIRCQLLLDNGITLSCSIRAGGKLKKALTLQGL